MRILESIVMCAFLIPAIGWSVAKAPPDDGPSKRPKTDITLEQLQAEPNRALAILDGKLDDATRKVMQQFCKTKKGRAYLFDHFLKTMISFNKTTTKRMLAITESNRWVCLYMDDKGVAWRMSHHTSFRPPNPNVEVALDGGVRGGGSGTKARHSVMRMRNIQELLGSVATANLRSKDFDKLEFSFVPPDVKINVPQGSENYETALGPEKGVRYVCLALMSIRKTKK